MKKATAIGLMISLLICCCCGVFFASANFNDQDEATGNIQSDVYYMLSLDEEMEMFSKNADQKTAPAAFVKVLGAVTALDKWSNLDETIEITEQNRSLVTYGYGVRTADLTPDDSYTKRQLIETLLVYGANDAASVVAYEISGSAEGYINEMNAMAKKIGCTRTKVKSLTGFDTSGQYTTAKDVAAIIRYAMQSPVFLEAFSAKSITLPATARSGERVLSADNKMMNSSISDYYVSAVTGGKQTTTSEAGECIAVLSAQDGYNYLTVVMKGKMQDIDRDGMSENTAVTDAKQLLNWVYNNIRYRVVATTTQTVSIVNVIAGRNSDTLRLVPEKETSTLVPAKATSNSVLIKPIEETVPKRIVAPVTAGDVICQAKIFYADREIATINLVAANTVRLSVFRLFMTHLRSLLSSTVFILIEVAALILIVLYLILFIMKNQKKKKPALHRVPDSAEQKPKTK